MDRNRSRSPHGGTSYEEIVQMITMREQARLGKDWTTADSIRDKLHAAGVSIQDRARTWKSSDGKTGRIPTFSEIEAGGQPTEVFDTPQETTLPAGVGVAGDGSEAHIKYLIQMREQARAAKDWAQSDQLRDELKAIGVTLSDRDKMWKSSNGTSGIIIGYRGAGGPTDLEITTLVLQREKVRQGGDYATSDMIRNELKAAGVQIMDRDKVWKAADGRQGPIPSWESIQNGAGIQSSAPVAAAPAMPAMPTRTMPTMPTMPQVNTTNLQSQLVQAAMAAAANPATAARTLQLLQQAAAAPPAPAPVRAAVPRATTPRPVTAASKANSECLEAIGFVRSCQATGRAPLEAEIDWLVGLREKFRQNKDFDSADELRTVLRSVLSLELNEKDKTWSTPDGRSGVIPLWSTNA